MKQLVHCSQLHRTQPVNALLSDRFLPIMDYASGQFADKFGRIVCALTLEPQNR